jgi:FkbM family methyltransferase
MSVIIRDRFCGIKKLKSLLLRIFNKLENNGNANFNSNGENHFIDSLISSISEAKDVCIFDIGANTGDYSSILFEKINSKNINAQIHLFEPTNSCFKTIREKFQGINNIYLNNFGASDLDGEAKIFYDKEQSGLASLYQRNLECYNISMNYIESINLKRLDSYIKFKGIKHINFVKIDIEGHELKALEGFGSYLSADFIDYIQFEYGGANLDSKTSLMELYMFFLGKGFTVAKVMPKGLEIRQYNPFMENFSYANYMAISNKLINK